MGMIKFLHCADIHLDMPFTSLGADNTKSQGRRQDLKDTFDGIIKVAKAEKVDILLISGDLYEHDYVKKSTISYVNGKFSEIPLVEIFIVPGNHDPYIVNSYYRNYEWNANVHILTGDNPYAYLEEKNTYIYGMGFEGFYEGKRSLDSLRPVDLTAVNILLAHGTVDLDIGKDMYNPLKSAELAALNMDYIAMGHFHNRIDDIGGYGHIFNPGSPEPLGFDEAGGHGVFLGSVTKSVSGDKSLEAEFIKLNKRFYENIDINVSGFSRTEQVIERVHEAIGDMDMKNGLFYVTLKGYIERGFRIDPAQVQAYFSDRVYFLKVKDGTAVDYDFDELLKEPGLRGLFTRKMFAQMEKAEDDHKRELLLKALYYGLDALEQGKVEIG